MVSPLTPMGIIDELLANARALLDETMNGLDTLSVADGRKLYSQIREAEGWLESVRKLLEPDGVL